MKIYVVRTIKRSQKIKVVYFLRNLVFKYVNVKTKYFEMPGDNCSVNGCGVNRRMKGMGIFKIPSADTNSEWRKKWLGELLRFRELDVNLRAQIKQNRVFICERHFKTDEIELSKYHLLSFKKELLLPYLNEESQFI